MEFVINDPDNFKNFPWREIEEKAIKSIDHFGSTSELFKVSLEITKPRESEPFTIPKMELCFSRYIKDENGVFPVERREHWIIPEFIAYQINKANKKAFLEGAQSVRNPIREALGIH